MTTRQTSVTTPSGWRRPLCAAMRAWGRSSTSTTAPCSPSFATACVARPRPKTSRPRYSKSPTRVADRFDYRGVPIEGWLMGIARNLCRDRIKKLGRRGFEEELDERTGPAEADPADVLDLREDLRVAMRVLTEDQQEVLSLRFLLDKSVEDTARLMNRSEDAVKNLQRRALAAMQRALADAHYPGATGHEPHRRPPPNRPAQWQNSGRSDRGGARGNNGAARNGQSHRGAAREHQPRGSRLGAHRARTVRTIRGRPTATSAAAARPFKTEAGPSRAHAAGQPARAWPGFRRSRRGDRTRGRIRVAIATFGHGDSERAFRGRLRAGAGRRLEHEHERRPADATGEPPSWGRSPSWFRPRPTPWKTQTPTRWHPSRLAIRCSSAASSPPSAQGAKSLRAPLPSPDFDGPGDR